MQSKVDTGKAAFVVMEVLGGRRSEWSWLRISFELMATTWRESMWKRAINSCGILKSMSSGANHHRLYWSLGKVKFTAYLDDR